MSGGPFGRLAVVGMGLVGGSVARAAIRRGAAREVRGVDPALHPDEADGIPLCSLQEAGRWADQIVLAVPIQAMDAVMAELAPHLGPETILTDTASVKVPVAEAARRHLPQPDRCVGAHPMAGGDGAGFACSDPELFQGAACILALGGTESPQVVDPVEEFWQCLGAFTVRKTPEEHDAIAALVSHAPHLIAFAFAQAFAQGSDGLPGEESLHLAGGGLRDFIRIARSNPALWCEILLMNRSEEFWRRLPAAIAMRSRGRSSPAVGGRIS